MKRSLILFAFVVVFGLQGQAQTPEPLKLIQTIEMQDVPVGPYTDHLAVDLKGQRLFATPQARKSVQVFDLNTGKFLHEIAGLGNLHAVIYREDLDRIIVVDGDPGLVRIYDGRDYHPLQTVALLADADSLGYDPATKIAYVTNGGRGAKLDYTLLSAVDTGTGEHTGDIKVPTGVLEAMAIESSSSRIYIDLTRDNQVAVLDRDKRAVIATWPITRGKRNIAIALDEEHHRLFVGCRNGDMNGNIVVIDTQTGNEIDALPIGGWVDYLAWDPAGKRIYASCGTGYVYVFQSRDPDHYELTGKAETAVMAKTALLVPELHRLFVSVPHIGGGPARIFVFQTQ
jgi:DNA-binding beta-propeller fold protein YncE